MIEQLDQPVAALAALSTSDLATIQAGLNREADVWKRRKATFDALLLRNYETIARAAYTEAKKDTGTLTITAPGSNLLALKVEIDKTVVWDQDGLMKVLNAMPAADAKHYGKLKVEIPEAKYTAAPPAVQEQFKKLRTVKAGKMKFTFVSPSDAEAEAA